MAFDKKLLDEETCNAFRQEEKETKQNKINLPKKTKTAQILEKNDAEYVPEAPEISMVVIKRDLWGASGFRLCKAHGL